MNNYAQHAAYYRAALLLGLVQGDTVISWADAAIERDADAPAGLLDLAMVPPHDLSELRHALQPLAERGESIAIVRALFDIARRDMMSGQRSVKDTITVLAQARRFLTLPANYFDDIDTLQDDHMLAGAGVTGSIAEVESRVRAWLEQFDGGEAAFLQESPC